MIGNYLHLSDAEFVDTLYQEWLKNPESIDSLWAQYFQKLHNGQLDNALDGTVGVSQHSKVENNTSGNTFAPAPGKTFSFFI